MKWYRDTLTNEHYLHVVDNLFWKVYKTVTGDYVLTLHDDDAGHGDDCDYFDTLAQAKREAEKRKDRA